MRVKVGLDLLLAALIASHAVPRSSEGQHGREVIAQTRKRQKAFAQRAQEKARRDQSRRRSEKSRVKLRRAAMHQRRPI
jgi:hypothetical protein